MAYPAVIPSGNVSFGGSGSNRTAILTPAPGATGLAEVGFLVSDGANTASNRFILTVSPTLGLDTSDDFDYPDGPLVPNSSFVWNHHSGTNDDLLVSDLQLAAAALHALHRRPDSALSVLTDLSR